VGVEIKVEGLTKRFGRQTIWEDVTMTIPEGEISVLLGPSGTGKSVFLKTLVGLLRPNAGHIWINGKDLPALNEHDLYQTRKLFGVLFQDGALFGSMNIYDNIAFPLREHTKKTESEIRNIVSEKMEMVGLLGSEKKLPGEISGGMRKRAGLARALVLDPEIVLFDEPDSGLDPVRTAYLNQLIVDLNAQIEATFLIVTHDINTARTVPDNIGLLFRRNLVMFGPRMELLTSDEPVVRQFLNGRKEGPIGMAEEKDAAQLAAEAEQGVPPSELPPIERQLMPTSGVPRRTQRATAGNGHREPAGAGARSDAAVKIIEAQKAAGNEDATVADEDMPTVDELDRDLIAPSTDAERPGLAAAKSAPGGRGKGESGSAPTTGTAARTSAKKAPARTTAKKAPARTTAKKASARTTAKKAPARTTDKKTAKTTATTAAKKQVAGRKSTGRSTKSTRGGNRS
jgi:phospholipid/cholesterol/gamma-HCH transport system ATP-binding protein